MPESRLISGYLADLAAELPGQIVEELADGLDETYRHHRSCGLGPGDAARAAVAEFGDPQVIVAGFTRASPARRAARALLFTGPGVGACWGSALIAARAWRWPVPVVPRVLFGVVLVSVIGLLAAAVLGRRYRPVRRTAAAACAGTIAVDAAMLSAALVASPALLSPLLAGAAVSTARLAFAARNLHRILAAY